MKDHLWTVKELAAEAERRGRSVSWQYLRKLLRLGKLRGTMKGKTWLIRDEDARKWLEEYVSKK